MDEHASAKDLLSIVTEFIEEFKAKFGDHVHILDWALHLDESTPHIHERHVFDCENKYGEVAPQQEKALEALGFELPSPAMRCGCFCCAAGHAAKNKRPEPFSFEKRFGSSLFGAVEQSKSEPVF